MTEATKVTKYPLGNYPTAIEKLTNVSAGDTALSVSTPVDGKLRRLLYVAVHYSAAPTHTGIIILLDSGVAATLDTPLYDGADNELDKFYVPNGKLMLTDDDVIKVTAPAGGGVITSAISIVTEIGE